MGGEGACLRQIVFLATTVIGYHRSGVLSSGKCESGKCEDGGSMPRRLTRLLSCCVLECAMMNSQTGLSGLSHEATAGAILPGISLFRLYTLRVAFLVMAAGAMSSRITS